MTGSDIFEEARQILGLGDSTTVYSRISDAVDVLSNKGNLDGLLGYVTVTAQDHLVTLPNDVDTPLKITLDGHPTFTRDRLYEFSLNGPGKDAERTDWSWEDKGLTPVFSQPIEPTKVKISSLSADSTAVVYITGRINASGDQFTESITGPGTSAATFYTIDRVIKPVTTSAIQLLTFNDDLLGEYQPNDTNPGFRQIRTSKESPSVYILFRKKFTKVTGPTDFIPIRSKMGLLFMIKSLQLLRNEDFNGSKELETQAIKLTVEEQTAHNAFVELASNTEAPAIRNLNTANPGTLIVQDVFDDFAQIFGPIGTERVYDKITEAKMVLANKCQWDAQRGYVDLLTDQYSYVTLPRYVDSILALNMGCGTTTMRNKWYQFHLNGFGRGCISCRHWQEIGEFPTIRDTTYPQKLIAIPEFEEDVDTEVRVYGYFRGKRLLTVNDDGTTEDGIIVDCNQTETIDAIIPVDRIERVTKAKSNGFIELKGISLDETQSNVLGSYWPDETEPRYRRIQLPGGCECVSIMYRTRETRVSSLTDPIHLKSKTAMVLMGRALKMQETDMAAAEVLEQKATMLLIEEQRINNQNETPDLEVDRSFGYGRARYIR